MRNLTKSTLLLTLLLICNLTKVGAQDISSYMTESQAALNQLLASTSGSNIRNRSIMLINTSSSLSELSQSTANLTEWMKEHPEDLYAKIYYGYGLLFSATAYLKNKNYFRAAELSKQGFFYIDEAVESDPDNWRLVYLRARMDSFISAEEGRCVIALKDIPLLNKNDDVPDELKAIIAYSYASALATCNKTAESDRILLQLPTLAGNGKALAELSKFTIPFLTTEELSHVLQPIVGSL